MSHYVVKIAVVEDDPSVRKGLNRLLRSYGFAVRLFESAEGFLANFEDVLPDCLILDIQLGGMSGLDLLDELRMLGLTVPTVVITARESIEDLRVALDRRSTVGAIPCLRKPFSAEALLEAVGLVVSDSQ